MGTMKELKIFKMTLGAATFSQSTSVTQCKSTVSLIQPSLVLVANITTRAPVPAATRSVQAVQARLTALVRRVYPTLPNLVDRAPVMPATI